MTVRRMARRTDPISSHDAALARVALGQLGRLQREAARLVEKFPGSTYRQLFERHLADCRRRRRGPLFPDPPSLMRRLCEVATHRGTIHCPISGRMVSQWWPAE